MKLYLAYRSGYIKNTRFLKEFEEESILHFFQKHWHLFIKEDASETKEYVEILGQDIYGFPIWKIDDTGLPDSPKSYKDLKNKLEKYVYSNEVICDEQCLKVCTDDDEIELAWFMFTEVYKQENEAELSIWFQDKLPIKFGVQGELVSVKNEILPKGNNEGCTYFVSCSIYDSSHFEDLEGAFKLENIRLPDLISHLNNNELHLGDDENYSYGLGELEYLQYISQKLNIRNLKDVLKVFVEKPITEIQGVNFTTLSIDDFGNLELRNNTDESILNYSEHICEMCINSLGEFYSYVIIFDDLWVEKNRDLANSIIRFGASWEI